MACLIHHRIINGRYRIIDYNNSACDLRWNHYRASFNIPLQEAFKLNKHKHLKRKISKIYPRGKAYKRLVKLQKAAIRGYISLWIYTFNNQGKPVSRKFKHNTEIVQYLHSRRGKSDIQCYMKDTNGASYPAFIYSWSEK